MKQHAEQVSSLAAEKRELVENIERQAELLSATLQVSVHLSGVNRYRSTLSTPEAHISARDVFLERGSPRQAQWQLRSRAKPTICYRRDMNTVPARS